MRWIVSLIEIDTEEFDCALELDISNTWIIYYWKEWVKINPRDKFIIVKDPRIGKCLLIISLMSGVQLYKKYVYNRC